MTKAKMAARYQVNAFVAYLKKDDKQRFEALYCLLEPSDGFLDYFYDCVATFSTLLHQTCW